MSKALESFGHVGEARTQGTQVGRIDLRKVAERGYGQDSGEYLADLGSIAVPIRDYTRAVVGSLAIIAPEYRLTRERVEKEVAPAALQAGKDVSSRLGYNA